MTLLLALATLTAVQWQHPAGLITSSTLTEVREKSTRCEWAQKLLATRRSTLQPWIEISSEDLRAVFPKRCGNVYHNFSCPEDRCRLTFTPLKSDSFSCPLCGKSFRPDVDAGIYKPTDRYHGTLYDGWACLFYETAGSVATDLGLLAWLDDQPDAARGALRGIEILMLYADTLENLPTQRNDDPQFNRILTYHREGESQVLNDLASAYELLRSRMSQKDRDRFQKTVLERMLNDVMLEPLYTYNHNNLYQWHRTLLQTGLALEREDLLDWSFGQGAFDPEHQPEHRSIRRLLSTHFKPDGAYWEMCSGYHLYPLSAFCELAVISRHLSDMDPERFPRMTYDLTDPDNPGAQVIGRALRWFLHLAMPDRTMPTLGDSPKPRAGMDSYAVTAEVGYRYYDLKEVGDYEGLRQGNRSWFALLQGSETILQHPTPFESVQLSSGWVSLRNEWKGNRTWVGLNALIPGGGHQHADRLTLLWYSCGQLLALEKGSPYNDSVTRELATLSPMHNTVTVDKVSMKQGEALTEEETPVIFAFQSDPWVQFAELRGDRLYPQAKIYRRSVALVEDVVVDVFRVEGGQTHDWMLHHAGAAPVLSIPLTEGSWDPASWTDRGIPKALIGRTDGSWEARWKVADVFSRLSMMGCPGTLVAGLETYPLDNAVITPQNPACQSLCVRRENDAPFVALWDAWKETPTVEEVKPGEADHGGVALRLKTRDHVYHLLFGRGSETIKAEYDDGVGMESDALFAIHQGQGEVSRVSGTFVHLSNADPERK